MAEYRVNLEIYSGPLDLLLYLIRREEIDIHDIPIAGITQQYCDYVATLKQINPDLAGEFLVLAATLMEIKTRMLLPRPEGEEEGEEAFDPRAELVRQLLEYKAFKDAADQLRVAAAEQSLRFPRRPGEQPAEKETKSLEEIQLWDLVEAFNSLMSAIGHSVREAEIIYDDTPVELHATDIVDRLQREGNMTFQEVFAGRASRTELVGLFLALLELALRRTVFLEQDQPSSEIYVFLNPNPPPPGDSADAASAGAPAVQPAAAETGAGSPGEGQDQRPEPDAAAAPEAEVSNERRSEDESDGS